MNKILFLTLFLCLFSCYREDDFLLSNIDENEFLSIAIDNKNLKADAKSSSTVSFFLPLNTVQEKRKVKFNCQNCTFSNGANEIESDAVFAIENGQDVLLAKEKVTSTNKVEDIKVTGRIEDFELVGSVNIERAHPDTISIIQPSFTISYGFQTLEIKTELKRKSGVPSERSLAELVAIDSLGRCIGYFLNYSNISNENNVIINNYSLGNDTLSSNNVFLVATSVNDFGEAISDTITLNIN